MRTLDPSNDYVFKILFKDPGDERRLVAMLNAIVDSPSPIVSATVLNPQIPADVATAKSIVLDILVRLEDGRLAGIEMESRPRRIFVERELYYWARTHSQQLGTGEDYTLLRPTIAIAWLANPRDGSRAIVSSRAVHTRYRICETTTHAELTDQLEIHLLDLRNLATDVTLSPSLRRWAEFFDHPTEAVLERLAEEDDIMADTIHKLRTVSADDQAYYIAEARFRGEFRLRSDLRAERDEGREEGREAGREEGREVGLEEGRAEGRELGRVEGREVGRVEGREAGREEGQLLALSNAVIGVLEARFGHVPAELRTRLALADSSALKSALSRAAVVRRLEEFTYD